MDEQLKALLGQMFGEFKNSIDASLNATNDRLNGLAEKLKAQPQPTPTPTPTPAPTPTPTPAPTPAPGLTPAENALLQDQTRMMNDLKKQVEAAAEREKAANERAQQEQQRAAVERSLSSLTTSGLSFASDNARVMAERLISSNVKRDESGNLIAGDNLPVEAFAKTLVDDHAYLFAAPATGGSGAGAASGLNRPGARQFQIEDIKPGMSDEDYNRAVAAIIAAHPR